MNREFVEKRIALIKQSIEQLVANHNALIGAKQECDFWLSELDKQESQSNVPDDAKDGEKQSDQAQN